MRLGGGQLLNWGPHIVDHALQFLESPVASMWSDLKKVAAVGDAEDHLKIVLRGTSGRLVDLEISGGCALGEPVYWVAGSKGALTSNEKTIELRYIDPKAKLGSRRAKAGVPEYGSFGSKESLPWITESREVRKDISPECIWDALYATIREGAPFRVTLEESLEVMRVLSAARKGTPFENVG
jgi:predicted dehydrogenase